MAIFANPIHYLDDDEEFEPATEARIPELLSLREELDLGEVSTRIPEKETLVSLIISRGVQCFQEFFGRNSLVIRAKNQF